MSDNLNFDLELSLNDINAKLSSVLQKTSQQAEKAGKSAGSSFSNAFKGAIVGVLAGISIGNIVQGTVDYFKKSISLALQARKATVGLETSLNNAYDRQARLQSVLKSDASIEDKARALGKSNDEIYESVSAGKASEEQTRALRAEINNLNNAYKEESNRINETINGINAKTKAQVEAIRLAKGYGNLTKDQSQLEEDLLNLDIQKREAKARGDTAEVIAIENQMTLKENELGILNDKIKLVDKATDSVEKLANVEIQQLRAQLDASKNRLDIDIQPAQEKLDELAASAGGTVQRLRAGVADMVKRATEGIQILPPKEKFIQDFKGLAENVYKDSQGIISRSRISQGIRDLTQFGITDVQEATNVFNAFRDVITLGKSDNISFGEAFSQLTEQFRTGRAALGETAGLTEEYLSYIDQEGLKILQKSGKTTAENTAALTDQELVQARYQGLLKVGAERQGAFNEQADNGTLAFDKLTAQQEDLQTQLGEVILPILIGGHGYGKGLIQYFGDFVNVITNWIKDPANQEQIKKIQEFFLNVFKIIADFVSDPNNLKKLKDFFNDGVNAVKGLMDELNKVKKFFENPFEGLGNIGKNGFLGTSWKDGTFLGLNINQLLGIPNVNQFQRRAGGGLMQGTNVPYLLNDGGGAEYVVNHRAVNAVGVDFLDMLNSLGQGGSTVSGSYNTNSVTTNNFGTGGTMYSPSFSQL